MRKYTVAGLTLVLIAALSCGNDDDGPMGPVGPSGPATGDIMVSLVMSGSDLDADGCAVTVDSGSGQQVSPGATVAFSDLTSGSHEVTIGDVAANCEVDGATSRSVTVAAGQTAREVFTVVCAWGSRIAFTHHDAVHVMNPDGTGRAQLTHHGTGVWGPAWSPDGTRIVYELVWVCGKDDTSCSDIWVVNADGTGQTRLTDAAESVSSSPVWSPTGAEITFYRHGAGSYWGSDIWVMNADGTGQTNLTDDWDADRYPTWAPDGSRIVFVCRRDDRDQICAMNADGTDAIQLTSTSFDCNQPAWSPDGTRIAFQGGGEIYVMNPDGTGLVSLAEGSFPTWSPVGGRIAFLCRPDGTPDICATEADGSSLTQLTDSPDRESSPSWSPDGTQIVFARLRECGQSFSYCSDLFAMNADGEGEARLTNSLDDYRESYRHPAWSPSLY